MFHDQQSKFRFTDTINDNTGAFNKQNKDIFQTLYHSYKRNILKLLILEKMTHNNI